MRAGDDANGFSAEVDALAAVVRVAGWGFWNPEVARHFGSSVLDVCLQNPKVKEVVLDMRDLKPMRDEGQDSLRTLMASLPRLGIARATLITASHLTKLQLLRIVKESGSQALAHFIEKHT
jgi:hypothetical protein